MVFQLDIVDLIAREMVQQGREAVRQRRVARGRPLRAVHVLPELIDRQPGVKFPQKPVIEIWGEDTPGQGEPLEGCSHARGLIGVHPAKACGHPGRDCRTGEE
jgi:hypothetical protein